MPQYPMSFGQLLDQLVQFHESHCYRMRDQLAYHLSVSLPDDLFYVQHFHGTPVAEVSAKYLLQRTMRRLDIY